MAEGARLESVFRGNSNLGSNPSLSAKVFYTFLILIVINRKQITYIGSLLSLQSHLSR